MYLRNTGTTVLWLWPFLCITASVVWAGESAVDFNGDIRPILSDNCFRCHGNDSSSREADLRLDQEEIAKAELPSGVTAIVPGKPDESELVSRITEEDESMRMPPVESGKSLTKQQIALLTKWIAEGAKYDKHWAFKAPVRPELPEVQQADWPKNAIDRFVLARLERESLKPSPEADRATLIRRVTLDLTGLPPTPEEVEAFVADESPDAYEKLVDRLFQSPRYGEHKARYWLDAVRYADTHGMHFDAYREIWPYRDWVIRALNENMPFDRFVTEQLGGDLLPNASLQDQVASGYNRCNLSTNEGGAIPEEVYVRNVVDRVDTMGTVFLGLTINCAQCHDHKYDPISQKEFYQFFAFFNNLDGNSMDGNMKDHAPYVKVPTDEERARFAELDKQIAEVQDQKKQRIEEMEPAFLAWLNWLDTKHAIDPDEALSLDVSEGLVAYYPLDEQAGEKVSNVVSGNSNGSVHGTDGWASGRIGGGFRFAEDRFIELGDVGNFAADSPFSYGAWIKAPGDSSGAAIARMDDKKQHRGYDLHIVDRRVAAHFVQKWPQYAIRVITKEDVLEPNHWHHVFVTFDGSRKAQGVSVFVDGVRQDIEITADSLSSKSTSSLSTSVPMLLGRRDPGAPFVNGEIDDVRIYKRALLPREVAAVARIPLIQPILALGPDQRTEDEMQILRSHYFDRYDSEILALNHRVDQINRERHDVMLQAPTTLVFRERKEIRPAYLLERGSYEHPLEKVSRTTPAVLPPMADDLSRDRLGLAKWLTAPDHPLTARVAVNRYWQQYFGTGLVKTSENFGLQGDPPSHPELLDWLAREFIDGGWDMKRLHRLIVTSATYRQSSRATADAFERDPENRLLARGPRFRLDAEMLRDQALAVSGLLVNKLGGPSVKPPQPDGLWKAVGYTSSNTANFKADTGDKIFRRSVYIFWKRTSPPPYLTICDAPSREESRVRRERTNTPLAALLLMNETQYVQAACRLGERAMKEVEGSPEDRAEYIFQQVVLRKAAEQDVKTLTSAYDDFVEMFRQQPEEAKKLIAQGTEVDTSLDPAELAAWTMVANTVLNLDEVINKN